MWGRYMVKYIRASYYEDSEDDFKHYEVYRDYYWALSRVKEAERSMAGGKFTASNGTIDNTPYSYTDWVDLDGDGIFHIMAYYRTNDEGEPIRLSEEDANKLVQMGIVYEFENL